MPGSWQEDTAACKPGPGPRECPAEHGSHMASIPHVGNASGAVQRHQRWGRGFAAPPEMGAGLRSATRERYPLHFLDRGSCTLLLGPCLAEGFQTNCKIKEAALPLRVPRHDVGNCDSPVILLMTINRDRRAQVLSSGAALLCLITGPRCPGITGSRLFLSSRLLSPVPILT